MNKTLIILFWCLSCSAYAGDDITITFHKMEISEVDSSHKVVERNFIRVEDGNIYHLYQNDKGAYRKLLPGELEKIKYAMKSQLANAKLDDREKPRNGIFFAFGLEYDVGIRNIKYEFESISIHDELSPEMIAIFDEYFPHHFH